MQPERVIRFGAISASVFVNEIDTDNGKKTIRNVKLQRRYRNGDGEWKSSSSFTLADLPVVVAVLERAMEYVAGKTLDALIPLNGMRLGEALKYAVQIAAGPMVKSPSPIMATTLLSRPCSRSANSMPIAAPMSP